MPWQAREFCSLQILKVFVHVTLSYFLQPSYSVKPGCLPLLLAAPLLAPVMPAHGNFEGALASINALNEAEREEAAQRKSSTLNRRSSNSLRRQLKEKHAKQSKKRKHGEQVPLLIHFRSSTA